MADKLNRWASLLNKYGKEKVPFFFMMDFEMQKPVVLPLNEVDKNDLLFDVNGICNDVHVENPPLVSTFAKHPISHHVFHARFQKVQNHLRYGNSFLVNLTFPTPIETNLSLKEIFLNAKQPYKLWVKDQFVVFSPETFVKIEKGIIHSHPMKGTIDASIPNAASIILEDKKEAAEHATIVDLIRNDLSMVAENVTVEAYRYIETIHTNQKDLLQVSSLISGSLPDNWNEHIGDILLKLLPAGSICGAPKPKTLQIIKDAEMSNRDYYTGVMGVFDGEKLDTGVMIRFVEQQTNGLVFRSGGGITAQSNSLDEYNEMVDKVYFPWRE